jgi:poly-gamma-glutamate synthesis protein (capsule biosynthesis protein)
VALLPDLADSTADGLAARLREGALPGDIRVVSLHWGGNWGYEVPGEHRRFAHRLVDGGIHVVHGHSSHHPRPVEVYRGCLVLYGCGDLVNDYEGISGYEEFRDDLRLLYLARLEAGTGRLLSLRMVPLHARRLSLERAGSADTQWLARVLDDTGRVLGTRVRSGAEGELVVLHA